MIRSAGRHALNGPRCPVRERELFLPQPDRTTRRERTLFSNAYYLPVTVPGALLSIGDGHAAQGDGEVAGTAIECGMTTELQLELVTQRPVPGAHAETPAGQVTFGFSPDPNAAMGDALDAMLTWLQASYGVGKAAALALASPVLDLRVTQVANESWGVHALLAADTIS